MSRLDWVDHNQRIARLERLINQFNITLDRQEKKLNRLEMLLWRVTKK